MLKSNLCNYSDAYILVKKNIAITRDTGRTDVQLATAKPTDKRDKEIAFKNSLPSLIA